MDTFTRFVDMIYEETDYWNTYPNICWHVIQEYFPEMKVVLPSTHESKPSLVVHNDYVHGFLDIKGQLRSCRPFLAPPDGSFNSILVRSEELQAAAPAAQETRPGADYYACPPGQVLAGTACLDQSHVDELAARSSAPAPPVPIAPPLPPLAQQIRNSAQRGCEPPMIMVQGRCVHGGMVDELKKVLAQRKRID